MIKNDQQLAMTKQRIDDARALETEGDSTAKTVYSEFIQELETEVREYESIRAGFNNVFRLSSIDDLGEALVKCRLALGMTQESLALKLGLKEQQIQRYEASEYEKAPLWKLAEIADVMECEFYGVLRPII